MSYDVTCGSCGHRNPMGRLYCMSCGAKLEVTEKSVSVTGAAAQRGRNVLRGLRLLITLGLLVVLVQLMRPVQPRAEVGSRSEANILGRKLTVLQDALMEHRARTELLPESEINAYLFEILQRSDPSRRSWLGLNLQTVQIRLVEGKALVLLSAGQGAWQITQEINVTPVRSDGGWTCEVTAMRIGHLPLPRSLAKGLAARSGQVFGGLSREAEVLKRMNELRLSQGVVEAITAGR